MNTAAAVATAAVQLCVLIGVLFTAPGPMPSRRVLVAIIAELAGTSILMGILAAGAA